MDKYRVDMNSRSKDGCAGLRVARRQGGENLLIGDCLIWLQRTIRQWEAMMLGSVLMLIAVAALAVLRIALRPAEPEPRGPMHTWF